MSHSPRPPMRLSMTTNSSIDDPNDKSARAWLRHKRRVLALVAAGLLVTGSFLLWGPIGIGNGPLTAAIGGMDSAVHPGRKPVGFIISIQSSGDSRAVVDGIELIGGTRYPAPHLLGLEVLTSGDCGGVWPTRPTERGFALAGCGGAGEGPLVGHAFGRTHPVSLGFSAAAEVAAPRRGACWVMTKIVVHYHVGIRHYSATDPYYQLVVCADSGQAKSAADAASSAG